MTLHQLRIFLSVAQSRTLTAASKQLDLAQPSVSKQLVALEESVGARLFVRFPNRTVLTDAGRILLRHAQSVVTEMDETEASLREFATRNRPVVRVAGLNSVIKALLPGALMRCSATSQLEVDIQEVVAKPGDVLEMLYSGQIHIGLIAADSVAQASVGFRQVPIVEDPYVFAVPNSIDLGAITDINSAPADVARVLNSCIVFSFGTLHRLRVREWYQRALPSSRFVVYCRSYETALELVRVGFGVSLVPALPAFSAKGRLAEINLFATDYGTRRTVAILADRHLHLAPYKQFVEALQNAGGDVLLQPILPMPRLIQREVFA